MANRKSRCSKKKESSKRDVKCKSSSLSRSRSSLNTQQQEKKKTATATTATTAAAAGVCRHISKIMWLRAIFYVYMLSWIAQLAISTNVLFISRYARLKTDIFVASSNRLHPKKAPPFSHSTYANGDWTIWSEPWINHSPPPLHAFCKRLKGGGGMCRPPHVQPRTENRVWKRKGKCWSVAGDIWGRQGN